MKNILKLNKNAYNTYVSYKKCISLNNLIVKPFYQHLYTQGQGLIYNGINCFAPVNAPSELRRRLWKRIT